MAGAAGVVESSSCPPEAGATFEISPVSTPPLMGAIRTVLCATLLVHSQERLSRPRRTAPRCHESFTKPE